MRLDLEVEKVTVLTSSRSHDVVLLRVDPAALRAAVGDEICDGVYGGKLFMNIDVTQGKGVDLCRELGLEVGEVIERD